MINGGKTEPEVEGRQGVTTVYLDQTPPPEEEEIIASMENRVLVHLLDGDWSGLPLLLTKFHPQWDGKGWSYVTPDRQWRVVSAPTPEARRDILAAAEKADVLYGGLNDFQVRPWGAKLFSYRWTHHLRAYIKLIGVPQHLRYRAAIKDMVRPFGEIDGFIKNLGICDEDLSWVKFWIINKEGVTIPRILRVSIGPVYYLIRVQLWEVEGTLPPPMAPPPGFESRCLP